MNAAKEEKEKRREKIEDELPGGVMQAYASLLYVLLELVIT